jgi:hypothetical protein
MININDIEKQVQETIALKVEAELKSYNVTQFIDQYLSNTIQDKVNSTVTALINKLINTDTITKQITMLSATQLQEKIDLAIKARAAQTVSQTDLGKEISARIESFVDTHMRQAALPAEFIPANAINWKNFKLPANQISKGTIEDFNSNGIEDYATEINLTILDGQVVVEHEFVTKNLTVVEKAKVKDLTVTNLTVENNIIIQSGKFVEEVRNLIDNRLEQFYDRPLDLKGAALTSNQTKLIDSNSLGPSIVESNLRKVGRLSTLSVVGETNLAETLYVNNSRLGINTDEPAGPLTIWDEEAEFTIRKFKNRNMYIGSTRDSNLTLGVGGNSVLEIHPNGINTKTVKIGHITISTGDKEPTHRGSPSDMVINTKPEANQPWAWRCMGGEKWAQLT